MSDLIPVIDQVIAVAKQTARIDALMDAEKAVRDRADRMSMNKSWERKALILAANDIAALQVFPEGLD